MLKIFIHSLALFYLMAPSLTLANHPTKNNLDVGELTKKAQACGENTVRAKVEFQISTVITGLSQMKEAVDEITEGLQNGMTPRSRWVQDFNFMAANWRNILHRVGTQDEWSPKGDAKMDPRALLIAGQAHDLSGLLHTGTAQIEYVETLPCFADGSCKVEEVLPSLRALALEAIGADRLARRMLNPDAPAQLLRVSASDILEKMAIILSHIDPKFKLKIKPAPKEWEFYADEWLLIDALRNIINNSMQHGVPDGGIMVLGAFNHRPGELEFSVGDLGKGMTVNESDRIFDPFVSSPSTARNAGLGMHRVKHIVQEHAGQIEVIAHPGMGVIFHLRFAMIRNLKSNQVEGFEMPGVVPQHSVLAIEDSPTLNLAFVGIMRNAGISAFAYTNTTDAASVYTTFPEQFVAITIDRGCIKGNVEHFVRGLRKVNPKVKIFLVSGKQESEVREDLPYFDGFYSKPSSELNVVIKEVVAESRTESSKP